MWPIIRGGRRRPVSWTDTDGNLWLFGGHGYAESGNYGDMNDLWRFNITSKEWTWMSGNKTTDENGVYGMKGIPDTANYPGGRQGSVSWTDTDGNYWLFGGSGYAESGGLGALNDLWRFNITSKEWAWMSGNKTTNENGVYGTKGVPNLLNYPGARYFSGSWTDIDGNYWLFGGSGYAESGSNGRLNDLWRFNITSKEWAWMSGNKTTDQYGVYGTKGVPDIANYPGARSYLVSWTDIDGNFWIFGGGGYAESDGPNFLDDLWRFNITSKKWTWISGHKTIDEHGVYGTKEVPDMANYPGSRQGCFSWTDTDGTLWLFGGHGWPESGGTGMLNDLWRFQDSTAPYITIIEPTYNKLFNETSPTYNLTFIDAHLNDTWYRIGNGTEWSIYYTIPGLGPERTGQINQDAWNDWSNGTVIIEFYANDTYGNLRMNSTTVRKDILGPLISINDPAPNEIFSFKAPDDTDCNVDFSDVSGIDAKWHMLINATNSNHYTKNYTWNDEVNQTAWNQMGNGTVIIRIFANDSSGYIGMAEVIVRKDIIAPNITIIEPIVNQSVYNSPPEFNIIVVEANNDTMWYRLFNGTHYTENRTFISNTTINEEDWEEMWSSIAFREKITIIFYCNDTAGNIGFANVTVIKSREPLDGLIPTDGDDDDGGNGDEEVIFGYDILAIIAVICCAALVLIKRRYKQIK